MRSNCSDCEVILQGFDDLRDRNALTAERCCKGRGLRDRNALAAERCCKGRGLRDRNALAAERHEFGRNEIQKKRSSNQIRTRATDSKSREFD